MDSGRCVCGKRKRWKGLLLKPGSPSSATLHASKLWLWLRSLKKNVNSLCDAGCRWLLRLVVSFPTMSLYASSFRLPPARMRAIGQAPATAHGADLMLRCFRCRLYYFVQCIRGRPEARDALVTCSMARTADCCVSEQRLSWSAGALQRTAKMCFIRTRRSKAFMAGRNNPVVRHAARMLPRRRLGQRFGGPSRNGCD